MTFARAIRCAGLALLAAAVTVPAAAPAQAPTGSATLSASLGMRIDGRLWRQHAGVFVAGAGDVNGDGLADVLIGTAESHRIGPGLPAPNWNLYVVFGRRGARGRVVRLDRLAAGGLHLLRHQGGFSAGAGVGDVNGDGLADVVLGSAIDNRRASAYVVYGRRRGETVDVDRLGSGGFVVRTGGNSVSGPAVAGAGDLDSDGLADIVIGDTDYVPRGGEFGTGRAVVVFGRRGSAPVDIRRLGRAGTTIVGPGPFRVSTPTGESLIGGTFGEAVAGVADVNGDGHRDVVVGSPYLGGREGGAFVVTRARRRGATIDTRAPENGWYRIAGAGGSAAGWSVASAGDQNRDGLNDLLIGSLPGRPFLASSSGPSSAYVVYGSRAARDVGLATLGAAGAVLLDEAGGDRAGQSVAGLGDVNGDGARDIAVAAPRTDFVREQSGSVYVIYGRERTMPHGGVKKGVGGGRSERGLARRR